MTQKDQVPNTNIKEHRFLIEDLNLIPPIEIEDDESGEDEGPTSEVVVKQENAQDERVLKENCARPKEQVAAKRKAPTESSTGESSTMEPMRNPSPVVPEPTAPGARKHANISGAAYGVQRQRDGSSSAYRQHLTGSPSYLGPRPVAAQPFMLRYQPSGVGILGPTPTGFRPNFGCPPQPNYMLLHTLPGTSPGNRSGPTPSGFRLNMGTPPPSNYMPPNILPSASLNNRTGPTYALGQVSGLNPPFLGAFRFRESYTDNGANPSGAGPSGLTMEQPRDEWSEEELDHLWIGVRRHGLGNWGAMLRDPHLKFSMSKTADDLDSRWTLQEAVKAIPMPPWSLTQRITSLGEPTSSNPPVTGAQPGSADPAKFAGDGPNLQGEI